MELSLSLALILALTPGTLSPIGAVLSTSAPLDLGYRQMYNLEFEEAHKTLRSYIEFHPDDPLGPTSEAAAYLFAEFDRLGVLQTELFVDDEKFKQRKRPAPDPALKEAFNKALSASDRLADARLAISPNDTNALYAQVLNLGLRADYLALIEKRNLASLSYIKSAGLLAQKLLAINPNYYDAYLALGFENYMLGLNPAPVRWLLRLYGAETDKDQGIKHLQLTAEKGHYLLPLARLLLAVAALREKDRAGARKLLANLAEGFPRNQLYRRELSRLK
ncbi:MAG TPA: hypothetical protein VFD30_11265 [Terriglobia bacterium]|jgi:hypothetical protein|nr:hypothetical protein [Terriglobia bacterium]